MPVVAMTPFHVFGFLFLGVFLFLLGATVWGGYWMLTRTRAKHALGYAAAPRAPDLTPEWLAGEDLHRYPDRLSQLEQSLIDSYNAAISQAEHLRQRGDRVAAKEDRSELAERYAADATALERRTTSMRRVLGLVWRTRSVLAIRAHVAVTARSRPQLDQLPQEDVPVSSLPDAADAFERSASDVRSFVVHVESRQADLSVCLPAAPSSADVTDDDRQMVADEKDRARQVYAGLQDRMDRLADTLAYLADRCRTRQVVASAQVGAAGIPGAHALMEELTEALAELEGLSEIGDARLAETALDRLSEDISQLEEAGLEAQAEADAALEVARLVEQFPS